MSKTTVTIEKKENDSKTEEKKYHSKLISGTELHKTYQLRHEVYAEELKWVPEVPSGLEIDKYEENSVSFGVFDDEQKLLATLRLIPSTCELMLENEFSSLVSPSHEIMKSSRAAEITRLCVKKDARNTYCEYEFGKSTFSLLLYRSLYRHCIDNKVRYLYMVVEYKILRLLCLLGFPCEKIGEPVKMPDGVKAVAALLDWREFEKLNIKKKPAMLRWFIKDDEKDQSSTKPLDSATATA